ncbi:MAG: hypothetical protein ACT4OT_06420 [Acidobacteriota bacterium]
MLLGGVVYTMIAPAAAVAQTEIPSTPEGWVKLYEDEAKKCVQEAYGLNRELQEMRGLIAESAGSPILVSAFIHTLRDYRQACWDYHFYLRRAQRARADVSTPTPTPTATPILTTPSASGTPRPTPGMSGTVTIIIWPRDENDLHVKFITDQKRKLRELKEEADKQNARHIDIQT